MLQTILRFWYASHCWGWRADASEVREAQIHVQKTKDIDENWSNEKYDLN